MNITCMKRRIQITGRVSTIGLRGAALPVVRGAGSITRVAAHMMVPRHFKSTLTSLSSLAS